MYVTSPHMLGPSACMQPNWDSTLFLAKLLKFFSQDLIDDLLESCSVGSFSWDCTICLSRSAGNLAGICLEKSQKSPLFPGLGSRGYKWLPREQLIWAPLEHKFWAWANLNLSVLSMYCHSSCMIFSIQVDISLYVHHTQVGCKHLVLFSKWVRFYFRFED